MYGSIYILLLENGLVLLRYFNIVGFERYVYDHHIMMITWD